MERPRIGCIGYATEQGLGRLAKSFYDAGVVDEMLIYEHPDGRPTRREWYPDAEVIRGRRFISNVSTRPPVVKFLNKVDVVLFFETPFDWDVLPMMRLMYKRSVLVPMYEWYLLNPPAKFDKIICPSKLDQQYFPGAPYLPIPVDGSRWQLRTTAKRYLHNAGGIGSREHKGTRQVVEALKYIKSDLTLTIRAQNGAALQRIVNDNKADVDKALASGRLKLEFNEIPYEQLWNDHDVLIQPEKYNGLSLPLQEAFAAGMMVLTTNRFPTNDWLTTAMIPVEREQEVQAAPGHNKIIESVVNSKTVAAWTDLHYGLDIRAYSRLGRYYGHVNSWDKLKGEWIREITS